MVYKIYSGAGNDFVMINNRDNAVPFEKQGEFTRRICEKQFPKIDGVIFVDKPKAAEASIRMNYFNRDGSYGAMCGNGARCIAQYSHDEGIVKETVFYLEAVDKIYKAQINGNNLVRIDFPPPGEIKQDIVIEDRTKSFLLNVHWIEVGSEHIVLFVDDELNRKSLRLSSLDSAKINEWGRELRYHLRFQPKGANVNFAEIVSGKGIRVRTYERGVERETLACGTGVISSAVMSNLLGKANPPVKVLVQSGEWLTVDFINDEGKITNLSLEGSARKMEEGEIRNN